MKNQKDKITMDQTEKAVGFLNWRSALCKVCDPKQKNWKKKIFKCTQELVGGGEGSIIKMSVVCNWSPRLKKKIVFEGKESG